MIPTYQSKPDTLAYSAPLDGIRAIAILAVLLFHIWPAALPGGFVGVDVFFVLSGFLISSIILHDLRSGSFSLREFYLRRIQRLLPNVIATVLAVLLLWKFFLPPGTVDQPAHHGLWVFVNFSNVYIWRFLGGYWGDAAEWAPLTHTWSLAVEEQFYLLYPGVLLLLARRDPGRVRFWLVAAAGLSFGAYLYGSQTHPDATFYLLPTRGWELLIGAILAARLTPVPADQPLAATLIPVKMRETLGWGGLAMIVVGLFVTDDTVGFRGGMLLFPTVGTVLILISVTGGESRVSEWLSSPFMVGTGKCSYSLYLWHWPLIIFGKLQADLHGLPPLAGAAAGGLAGILLGWAAYHVVEQPLRNRGPGRGRRVAIIAAGFSLVVVGCALFAYLRPSVDPLQRFDPPAFYGKLYDAGRPGKAVDTEIATSIRYFDVDFPPLPARHFDLWRTGGIQHLYGGGRPRIVVLGSSHALMYSRLIDDICRQRGLSVAFFGVDYGAAAFFETEPGPNFPTPRDAREFDEARKKWLAEWHPAAVLVIDRWDVRVRNGWRDFNQRLRSFLTVISPLAGRVVFVTQVPAVKEGAYYNLRAFVTWLMGAGNALPRLDPDGQEFVRQEVVAAADAAARDFPTLRVLRADRLFYHPDGSIRYSSGRAFFYTNSDHLTEAGSEEAAGLFTQAIDEAGANPAAAP